jgi:hypothetical protein
MDYKVALLCAEEMNKMAIQETVRESRLRNL